MPTFDYRFTVAAPVQAVSDFHHDTSVLKKLSPPPIFVQLHHFEPLGEGSLAEFTMWFGPVPVRWQAVHLNVGPLGFTDRQVRGPLQMWEHTHRFTPLDAHTTQVREHVVYSHPAGWRGLLTRLFIGKPGLTFLFTYRKMVTRWALRRHAPAGQTSAA